MKERKQNKIRYAMQGKLQSSTLRKKVASSFLITIIRSRQYLQKFSRGLTQLDKKVILISPATKSDLPQNEKTTTNIQYNENKESAIPIGDLISPLQMLLFNPF
jgi:hypothetical protein